MASQLDKIMNQWNAHLPEDSDKVFDIKSFVSQLLEGFPLSVSESLRFYPDVITDDTDWNSLALNRYFIFNSLKGNGAPDIKQMHSNYGVLFNLGNEDINCKLAISNSTVAFVPSNTSTWFYLSGSSSNSGSSDFVIDNYDGTITVNGTTFKPAEDSMVVHTNDLPSKVISNLADKTELANFINGLQINGSNVAAISDVNTALNTAKSYSDSVGAGKVTDNKDGSVTVNGAKYIPAVDGKVVHVSGNETINGIKTFTDDPVEESSGKPYITSSYADTLNQTSVHLSNGETISGAKNFTGNLMLMGNPVISQIHSNIVWSKLSVDSSQHSDYNADNTAVYYSVYRDVLYINGTYVMSANTDSSHSSGTLFKISSDILGEISFPPSDLIYIGFLQVLSQSPNIMSVSLNSKGEISTITNAYNVNLMGAATAGGIINANIMLN